MAWGEARASAEARTYLNHGSVPMVLSRSGLHSRIRPVEDQRICGDLEGVEAAAAEATAAAALVVGEGAA